jgi:hypothetical protein
MLRLLPALIVCCAFAQRYSANREIPLPEGISGAACITEHGRRYSSRPDGRTLTVDCVGPPETVVRCDFDEGEPLDLTLASLCAADTVPAVRASTVLVRVQRPTQLTAEWVGFAGPPDKSVSIVARRALTLQDSVTLPVAPRDDRFITFLRPGASPITVYANALGSRDGWALPDAAPGGELVARTSQAVITPVKYRLLGAAGAETTPVRNVATFRAVPAGAYDLVPEYEGEVRGERTPVRIQHGKVTFVALPEEEVGGVRVVGESVLCKARGTLAISEIRSSSETGAWSIETILTRPTRQECVHTIAGLRPGEYQVSLRGMKGQLAAETFQVAAQTLTPVAMSAESVQVSGRVSLNGRPVPNVELRFTTLGRAGPPHLARTDAEGLYELMLPAPGDYDVWFQRDGFTMLGNEREVTLSVGANYSDFDLQGATLKVMLKQWTRRTPVDILVTPVFMSKPGKVGDTLRVPPTEPLPVVFNGLGYGKYAVQAREHSVPGQEGGRVAGASVILQEAQPETEIELALTAGGGILRVVDQGGVPVAGAIVKAGDERLMQTTDGVFSLGNVAPATLVLVSAPGFAPVLRLVPNEAPFDIVLTRGKQIRLRFMEGSPPVISGAGSFLWSGTESPIPLTLFEVTRLPDATSDYIVHNFPGVAGVVYIAGPFDPPERYQPVTPDANGVIRIR